jgi:crotonobetainyl-CoA:carnitine CoA-transferase CaiB-like acyl-CoA transferase
VVVPQVAPRFSATPGALRRPAPGIGEHGEAILAEAGYDAAAIAALLEAQVIARAQGPAPR